MIGNETMAVEQARSLSIELKESLGFVLFMSTLCLWGILSNLPILLVYRRKYDTYASLYLLFILACIDLFVSSFVIPLTLLTTIANFYINSKFYCGLSFFFRYFSCSISVNTLALIAYERYQTISAGAMTKQTLFRALLIRRCKTFSYFMPVICFLLASLCFYFYQNRSDGCYLNANLIYFNIGCSILLAIVMIVLITLYVKIYLIVHRSCTMNILVTKLEATNKQHRHHHNHHHHQHHHQNSSSNGKRGTCYNIQKITIKFDETNNANTNDDTNTNTSNNVVTTTTQNEAEKNKKKNETNDDIDDRDAEDVENVENRKKSLSGGSSLFRARFNRASKEKRSDIMVLKKRSQSVKCVDQTLIDTQQKAMIEKLFEKYNQQQQQHQISNEGESNPDLNILDNPIGEDTTNNEDEDGDESSGRRRDAEIELFNEQLRHICDETQGVVNGRRKSIINLTRRASIDSNRSLKKVTFESRLPDLCETVTNASEAERTIDDDEDDDDAEYLNIQIVDDEKSSNNFDAKSSTNDDDVAKIYLISSPSPSPSLLSNLDSTLSRQQQQCSTMLTNEDDDDRQQQQQQQQPSNQQSNQKKRTTKLDKALKNLRVHLRFKNLRATKQPSYKNRARRLTASVIVIKNDQQQQLQQQQQTETQIATTISSAGSIKRSLRKKQQQQQQPKQHSVVQLKKGGMISFKLKTNSRIRKDWKVAQMFLLITILFIFSWTPWILTSLRVIDENVIVVNTYFLNNVINPLIYAFLSKTFRNEFFALFCNNKNKNSSSSSKSSRRSRK